MLRSQELKDEKKAILDNMENLKTLEEVKAANEKVDLLNAQIELAEKKEAEDAAEAQTKIDNGDMVPLDDNSKTSKNIDIKKIFAKVVAGKEVTAEEKAEIKNYVLEGDPKKGGVGVPPDVSTDIKQYQDSTRMFDIRPYITVDPVTTMSGSRPYPTNQPQASGFAPVDESKAIQALYEPTFDSMNYLIQKYGGYIPVTSELLEDDASGMYDYLVKWLAENELNTYAYQVFNGTGTKSAQGILTEIAKTEPVNGALNGRVEKITVAPTVDKFKSIINVDLETLTTDTIRIFTNADGYNYLDSLQDKQGRYYMQPDVTASTKGKKFLECEVVKIPKKFLPTDATAGIPFVTGDLRQLYTMYDRKLMSVQSSNVGGDAWRTDTTELKGVFRFDGKIQPQNVQAVKVLYAKF